MKTFKELREQTSTGADNWHRQNAAAGFDARANQILSGMLVNVAKDYQRQRQNRQVAQNELSQREVSGTKHLSVTENSLITIQFLDLDFTEMMRQFGHIICINNDSEAQRLLQSGEKK